MTGKRSKESVKGTRKSKAEVEPKAKRQSKPHIEPEVERPVSAIAEPEVTKALSPVVEKALPPGTYEGCYVGPFAEGTGVRVGSAIMPRIFPRNQWMHLSSENEAQALVELGNFKVRQV